MLTIDAVPILLQRMAGMSPRSLPQPSHLTCLQHSEWRSFAMTFLPRNKVKISSAAKRKILADFYTSPESTLITVLLYVVKSTSKASDGTVLSEKKDFFSWGAHWRSDLPSEAIWEVDGRTFVIQDGRWEPKQNLLLDVVDGQFYMKLRTTNNGS
ncbi:hypothetical protein [Yoonia sp. I 8.24]|uniref:hypothetical protein n=1 Tax=Yoonia sp. I 8.24 TaxID=1537229 RepID=UPI001EDFE714|nr:hypothetical protein [Yoonia sp. I 8.24]MCG3267423.1 hypothetical protein [Yoonia sp. I 8.24]